MPGNKKKKKKNRKGGRGVVSKREVDGSQFVSGVAEVLDGLKYFECYCKGLKGDGLIHKKFKDEFIDLAVEKADGFLFSSGGFLFKVFFLSFIPSEVRHYFVSMFYNRGSRTCPFSRGLDGARLFLMADFYHQKSSTVGGECFDEGAIEGSADHLEYDLVIKRRVRNFFKRSDRVEKSDVESMGAELSRHVKCHPPGVDEKRSWWESFFANELRDSFYQIILFYCYFFINGLALVEDRQKIITVLFDSLKGRETLDKSFLFKLFEAIEGCVQQFNYYRFEDYFKNLRRSEVSGIISVFNEEMDILSDESAKNSMGFFSKPEEGMAKGVLKNPLDRVEARFDIITAGVDKIDPQSQSLIEVQEAVAKQRRSLDELLKEIEKIEDKSKRHQSSKIKKLNEVMDKRLFESESVGKKQKKIKEKAKTEVLSMAAQPELQEQVQPEPEIDLRDGGPRQTAVLLTEILSKTLMSSACCLKLVDVWLKGSRTISDAQVKEDDYAAFKRGVYRCFLNRTIQSLASGNARTISFPSSGEFVTFNPEKSDMDIAVDCKGRVVFLEMILGAISQANCFLWKKGVLLRIYKKPIKQCRNSLDQQFTAKFSCEGIDLMDITVYCVMPEHVMKVSQRVSFDGSPTLPCNEIAKNFLNACGKLPKKSYREVFPVFIQVNLLDMSQYFFDKRFNSTKLKKNLDFLVKHLARMSHLDRGESSLEMIRAIKQRLDDNIRDNLTIFCKRVLDGLSVFPDDGVPILGVGSHGGVFARSPPVTPPKSPVRGSLGGGEDFSPLASSNS